MAATKKSRPRARRARAKAMRGTVANVALAGPNVVWGGNVTGSKAGAPAFGVMHQDAASGRALASELVDDAGDPADVNCLCQTYGLRREDLGRLTGFSLRALAEWSAGKLPSEPAKRRLHEIRRLLDALAEVVKVEAIPGWLKTRNPNFDNMTPIQVIEVGEIDRLWQMVYALGSDSVS